MSFDAQIEMVFAFAVRHVKTVVSFAEHVATRWATLAAASVAPTSGWSTSDEQAALATRSPMTKSDGEEIFMTRQQARRVAAAIVRESRSGVRARACLVKRSGDNPDPSDPAGDGRNRGTVECVVRRAFELRISDGRQGVPA